MVRQSNAYKFNGKCFFYNKFGHMAKQYRIKENQNYNFVLSQCTNCKKYGHILEDCRMNVKSHACGKFGYFSNHYRSRNDTRYVKEIEKNNVTCYACKKIGHIAKYCRRKNQMLSNDKDNEKGKNKVDEIKDNTKSQVRKFEEPSGDGSILVTSSVEQSIYVPIENSTDN